ncbi:peptidoglycan-binding domain-containing protein [uncultured Nonlabens sp.]|uniref:peptidoglycan-binding domain-containing protein n=1 Tax=uncultured Nonlabens sp. TaxID=859306 RepID=UPI00261935F4|nr:peptidoglycan-binding domain-containing protein [uncultured Nonlabens sp.]
MKPIIIFLLLCILGFISYDFYKDWSRFHSPEYHYKTEVTVDKDYHDPSVVMMYYDAITDLNSFIKLQWTANDIDVRLPEDDDLETTLAVEKYAQKLARVTYLEQKLAQSASYKSNGWNNQQIIDFENNHSSPEEIKAIEQKNLMKQLYSNHWEDSQRIGSKNALVFEIQKNLIARGYDMALDGVFAKDTTEALAHFESKNNLFPDGKIDVLTFEVLLK